MDTTTTTMTPITTKPSPVPRTVNIPVVVRVAGRDGRPEGPPHRGRLSAEVPVQSPILHIDGHRSGFQADASADMTGLRVDASRLVLRIVGDAAWRCDTIRSWSVDRYVEMCRSMTCWRLGGGLRVQQSRAVRTLRRRTVSARPKPSRSGRGGNSNT